LTIEVTGWCSAKARTGAGMVSVGTKAELMKGRRMIGYANAPAPSADFAVRPGITATHVNAKMNRIRMPLTSSQAITPAPDRKPMRNATSTTTTIEIRLAASEVSTCAHSTPDRAIGMDWNRSNIPPCTSAKTRAAV